MTMQYTGATWVVLVLHCSLCPLLCGFAIPPMEEAEPMEVSGRDKNQRVDKDLQE